MVTKRRKLIQRLKSKYKLVILDDETFEEKIAFTITRLNVFIYGSAVAMLIIFLVMMLIVATPLKEYIPGYADVSLRRDLAKAANVTDSLKALSDANDMYIANIQAVINGKPLPQASKASDKPAVLEDVEISKIRPKEDKELRDLIEKEEGSNFRKTNQKQEGITNMDFISPLKDGNIVEGFNEKKAHYSVDIATKQNEKVRAVLEGTVIFCTYSKENEWQIGIQHTSNIISIYKHCADVNKKIGNFVNLGDKIASAGTVGNGANLQFELWYKGNPVDPKDFITF